MPFLAFTNNNSALGRLPSYTGATNRDVYAWGAQFNEDSTAQSYASASSVQVGTGYVTTWYDQGGSAYHATNITSSNQPVIVNYGNIKKTGIRPTILFNGSGDTYLTTSGYTITQPNTTLVVAKNMQSTYAGGRQIYFGLTNLQRFTQASPTGFLTLGTGAGGLSSTTPIGTILRSYYVLFSGNSSQLYTNNNLILTGSGGLPGGSSLSNISIGGNETSNNFEGGISEIIYYNFNRANTRTGMESNLNTYYTIY
jgi:hypothetical protein